MVSIVSAVAASAAGILHSHGSGETVPARCFPCRTGASRTAPTGADPLDLVHHACVGADVVTRCGDISGEGERWIARAVIW